MTVHVKLPSASIPHVFLDDKYIKHSAVSPPYPARRRLIGDSIIANLCINRQKAAHLTSPDFLEERHLRYWLVLQLVPCPVLELLMPSLLLCVQQIPGQSKAAWFPGCDSPSSTQLLFTALQAPGRTGCLLVHSRICRNLTVIVPAVRIMGSEKRVWALNTLHMPPPYALKLTVFVFPTFTKHICCQLVVSHDFVKYFLSLRHSAIIPLEASPSIIKDLNSAQPQSNLTILLTQPTPYWGREGRETSTPSPTTDRQTKVC